jgi:DNA ligase (NAD+)
VLTPYAILAPVEIGGVTVKQATLHNFDFISEKDIREGDHVLVKRAGEVIPYVIGPIKNHRSGSEIIYQPPQHCPVCHEKVEHIEGEVAWFCVNSSCDAQLLRNIEHFVSRSAMDIVGLGYKIVEQLINEGLISDVSDLYKLERSDLLELEGFGEKKAENLLLAIENSKSQKLDRLITALGIRGVGEVVAGVLADQFGSLEKLMKSSLISLEEIPGIGPNIAMAIIDWFSRPGNQHLLAELKNVGVWPIQEEISSPPLEDLIFDQMTFVVTGKLENYSRLSIKDKIQALGGRVVGSVSSKTDYVVVGEDPGSKYQKAQELGISILSEKEFEELISSK